MVATASREYLGMTKSACPTDPAMRRFPQPVLPLEFLQKSQ
jgi:hypothetical protein